MLESRSLRELHRKPELIAEVKTESPFGWKSDNTWDELFEVANEVGDILSIHTDPRWGGSFELLTKARERTTKKILAKGIHETDSSIEEALRRGADFVLVVGRVPALPSRKLEQCFIEPLSLNELREVPKNLKAVWNSRDLGTGGMKTETFRQAREIFKGGWLCQASNIRTVGDIEKGADAAIIGTHLSWFAKSLQP